MAKFCCGSFDLFRGKQLNTKENVPDLTPERYKWQKKRKLEGYWFQLI